MEGEVPGGLFTGQYSLEFPEGKKILHFAES